MPIWRPSTPYRQPPWQPQPVRKPVGLGVAGGTTFNLSGTATQTQSLSLVRGVSLARALTQGQSLSLVRQAQLSRNVTQAQVALGLRLALAKTLLITQPTTLTIRRAVTLARSLTQPTTVSITLIRLGTTYTRTVSTAVAQILSLVATIQAVPPPVPVAVPTPAPATGTAVSNYLDWPVHIITSTDSPPPVGTAIGGP